nr:polygalacturonase-like [Leptinotarsa decemlineata]
MFSVKVISLLVTCWALFSITDASAVGEDCTITNFSQVSSVVQRCNNIVVRSLNVPAKQRLHLNLKRGSSLTFSGITRFGVAEWDGPLVIIQGDNLKVNGELGSKLDGQGAKYWDGKGGSGSKKPVLIQIIGSGDFNNIHLLNCPERCASVLGSHLSLVGWNIDVSAGDKNNLGHNTDGFDVVGTDITIRNSVVKNQDDCLVVNRGSDMHFQNIYCSGGHGLSLSIGMSKTSYNDNVARNITFKDCTVVNSDNAIHIKTHKDGAQGLIQDVTYKNITLYNIRNYGMQIQQDYPNHDGRPVGNVPIRGLIITDFKGTMTGKNSVPVEVVCAAGACSDWIWSEIKISGNSKPCSMNYYPSGFSC